jgi:outer membrane protein OmpA-like peptidoglycan-associated protein
MKIIISERQFKSILGNPDIINEQNDPINDNNALIVLQNAINDLIDKKQKEILDATAIKILGNAQDLKLQIGKKVYDMKEMVRGVYAIVIPPNTSLQFGASPMSTLLPEIEKIAEYKTLVEKHPEIRSQIEKGILRGTIYTDEQNQGTFKFTVTKKPEDVADVKSAVPFGTPYPLGEFLERNKVIYSFKNGLFGTLESGAISMNLATIPLKLTVSPSSPLAAAPPVQIQPMAIGDLFDYNGIEFKDDNTANQQMSQFTQQIKSVVEKYGEPFIKHIQSQNPTVLGYSSIDGDPAQKIVGEYKPCAGNRTRQEYDLCLSQERAKKIADMLNKSLPELGGVIKYKGMGETNQFGPGWTKESPTIPEQTAPNRRYVLTPINPFVQAQTV